MKKVGREIKKNVIFSYYKSSQHSREEKPHIPKYADLKKTNFK